MHIKDLVSALDEEISKLVACQVNVPGNDRFGGFLLPNYHVEPRMSGFALSKLILGYVCRESTHFLSNQLVATIGNTLVYMQRYQRPDGCFDLSGCNFASPPDTAFMINAVLNAWWVFQKRNVPEAEWLKEPLYKLIDSSASGVATGGFHTPNHRWAIASCLLHCAAITGRSELAQRARHFLNEGLDINEDGEFSERSAGNYNQVNDDQMIRLYMATGDEGYLQAARRNLEMMYAYIDPDDSVFTNNSTRQDYGRKVYTESYYELFLMTGYFLKAPSLGAMAEWIYQSSLRKGRQPGGVEWLLLYPEMDMFGADEPFTPPFTQYNRLFKSSRIARVRNEVYSYTIMEGKANFLYFQSGALTMYMVIYSNLCDRRNFLPNNLERVEGGFKLTAHAEGWYYLPYYPEKPATSDWWAMDNVNTRPKVLGLPLDTSVTISQQNDGIDVSIKTEGVDQLPLRVELGFPPDCQIRSDSFIMTGKAGESMTLLQGDLEVRSAAGDTVSLSPVFARHNQLARSDGAYPQSPEHFTIFLTDYTPVDRTIVIRTAPLPPPTY